MYKKDFLKFRAGLNLKDYKTDRFNQLNLCNEIANNFAPVLLTLYDHVYKDWTEICHTRARSHSGQEISISYSTTKFCYDGHNMESMKFQPKVDNNKMSIMISCTGESSYELACYKLGFRQQISKVEMLENGFELDGEFKDYNFSLDDYETFLKSTLVGCFLMSPQAQAGRLKGAINGGKAKSKRKTIANGLNSTKYLVKVTFDSPDKGITTEIMNINKAHRIHEKHFSDHCCLRTLYNKIHMMGFFYDDNGKYSITIELVYSKGSQGSSNSQGNYNPLQSVALQKVPVVKGEPFSSSPYPPLLGNVTTGTFCKREMDYTTPRESLANLKMIT